MVLVDDVVAGAEVGESSGAHVPAGQQRLGGRLRKTCVSGEQDEPELTPDEAAARRRYREYELRPRRAAPRPARAAAPRRAAAGSAVRSASPRCGKATTTRLAGTHERGRARSRPRRARARRAPVAAPRRRTAGCAGSGSSSVAARRGSARRSSSSSPDRTHLARAPRRDRAHLSNGGTRSAGTAREASSSSGRVGSLQVRAAARPPGRRPRSRPGCRARCVNAEKARIDSISSPKSSIRSGSRPVVGKTSTSPPRTANWPRSSTRSTRS